MRERIDREDLRDTLKLPAGDILLHLSPGIPAEAAIQV
jgi:hypothetical protein